MHFDPGLRIDALPGVYPPREDSRLLLEAVRVEPGDAFLEIGTGTGFVALHAAKVAPAVATDVSPDSVRCARRNAIANRLPLAVVRADLFGGIRGSFDVIALNPPYLVEPIGGDWESRAWQGGATGEDSILRFLEGLAGHLHADGRAYLLVPERRERSLAVANGDFRVSCVATLPLFFEKLLVLELTMPG